MYKQLNGFREITRNIKVEQYQVKFTTLRSLILPNGNAAIIGGEKIESDGKYIHEFFTY